MNTIAENVKEIRGRMAEAARRSGRDPREILLLAATKMNGADRVREAAAAGVDLCGENRVQEMQQKLAEGAYENVPLHFIGHLQKNKVKNVVGRVSLIQSVGSAELLEAIEKQAAKMDLVQDILFEINIGREPQKSGFLPEELPDALKQAADCSHIRLRGLMAIPPAAETADETRPYFAAMRRLFEKHARDASMEILSMGMSHDYEAAIEEGSTLVRIGTSIFGERYI